MQTPKLKFVAGAVVILGVLVWLGYAGVQETKTYYLTLPELAAQGEIAYERRLRVAGDVEPGTIERREGQVRFVLHQGEHRLQVLYTGRDPLPDTLVDNAQAVVTGRYTRSGVFEAQQVQAKCASKYEALPPGVEKKAATY